MSITEVLNGIYKELEEKNIDPTDYTVGDDEDMIEYALRYLWSNLDECFNDTFTDCLNCAERYNIDDSDAVEIEDFCSKDCEKEYNEEEKEEEE